MYLVYQLNTDTDSGEVFGMPVGYTADESINQLTARAQSIELTDLVYNTEANTDERIGDYTIKATGIHPDGYQVELFLQPLAQLD